MGIGHLFVEEKEIALFALEVGNPSVEEKALVRGVRVEVPKVDLMVGNPLLRKMRYRWQLELLWGLKTYEKKESE